MNHKILIIEHEVSLREDLVSALTQAGFRVAYAADYPEALLMLNEFRPDLVIMDTVLPTSDGFEACFKLRNIFDIPVVLLGESLSDEVLNKVMEADADLFELKPCRYVLLVARVKALLRRHPLTA